MAVILVIPSSCAEVLDFENLQRNGGNPIHLSIHLCALTALSATTVPTSYKEATNTENVYFWTPGIKREEDCIRENNTFALVDRKPEMHVLPCRYVINIKNVMPKVRIVAKGFRQKHGIYYHETFRRS